MNRKQRRVAASNTRLGKTAPANGNATTAELSPLRRAEALQRIGQYEQALAAYLSAIDGARATNSTAELLEALVRTGALLLQLGRRLEALPFLYDAVKHGGGHSARMMFGICIGPVRFSSARPELKVTLAQAIRERWVPPADLARVSTGLVMHEAAFGDVMKLLQNTATANSFLNHSVSRALANDDLLIAVMTNTLITDAPVERILTAYRNAFLLYPPSVRDGFMQLAIALAHQCFANEYAFSHSRDETHAVAALAQRLDTALQSGDFIEPFELAVLACYQPLFTLAHAPAILQRRWPDSMASLLARQVQEPAHEQQILPTLERITPIQDHTSEAVRAQYEENPYPRWLEAPESGMAYPNIREWMRDYFPHSPKDETLRQLPLQILVAGCGTGQQSVGSARRFASADVLAVDLSQTSLAYAARKSAELNITNIRYAQGDILELGCLKQTFDLVECAGVLHHLKDPAAGLRVLDSLTKPGGYLVLALYSEHARQPLHAVRSYAKEIAIGNSNDELRRFRQRILELPAEHPAAMIAGWRDFYSLSMVRDLVFHVQETRYTVPQLEALLRECGLIFCGFNLKPELQTAFKAMHGEKADFLSLPQWDIFERAHPDSFRGMYQFLVRKPA